MARLVAVMVAVRALASQRSRATAVHHSLGIGALPRCAHAASLLCPFFGHRAFWSVPLRTGLNVRVTTGQTPGPVTSTPSAVASTSPGYGPDPIRPSTIRVCLSSSPIPTHISATIRARLPGINIDRAIHGRERTASLLQCIKLTQPPSPRLSISTQCPTACEPTQETLIGFISLAVVLSLMG